MSSMSNQSNQGSDVTTDFPIADVNTSIYGDSLERWITLVDLLSPANPDIHLLMTNRNTSTNKVFNNLWSQMRNLYLHSMDSTENVSWGTFKDYLTANMSSIPYLALDDILTVMTGVTQLKPSTSQVASPSPSLLSPTTLKRPADEAISMSYTLAPFPIEVADAASLETILEGPSSVYDAGTSRQPTSEISCTTSIHGPDSSVTYTYPETRGKYYLQLKIYKFADVLTAPPEKLWTKALQVLTFVTKPTKHKDITFQDMKFVVSDRPEDPISKHTTDLITAIHRYSREHPKVVQSTKRKRFTNW